MTDRRPSIALTALLCALVAAAAFAEDDLIDADRPGIANSGTVIGRQAVQVETGPERTLSGAGEARTVVRTLPVLVRYGLSDRFELRLASNTISRQRTPAGPAQSGFGALAPGFKWQMIDGSDEAKLQDLGLIGSVTVPSGSKAFRQDQATGSLLAAADWKLTTKWIVNPNGGVATYHGGDGRAHAAPTAAVTLEYDVTERVHPAVEIARLPPDEGEDFRPLIVNAQIAWIVAPAVQFDVEAGRDLHDSSRRYLTAGISVRLRSRLKRS